MTTRTRESFVRFRHPFALKGVEHAIPPGEYKVTTEESAIEGLTFLAYRRVATSIVLPLSAATSASIEMVTIDPADLQSALERDWALPYAD